MHTVKTRRNIDLFVLYKEYKYWTLNNYHEASYSIQGFYQELGYIFEFNDETIIIKEKREYE